MESDLDLVVQKSNGCLIFEVYDNAPCFTSDLVRDDTQKGLMLVEKLSARLGYEKAEQCRLWCEVALDDSNTRVRQLRL